MLTCLEIDVAGKSEQRARPSVVVLTVSLERKFPYEV